MLLSQSCIYGIRAALLVTTKSKTDQRKFFPIKQLSSELDVSFHFLTKILQVLTHADIMESYKGPNGGVRLAKPAKSVFLMDIISAMDGEDVLAGCVLGLAECGEDRTCPLHGQCGRALSVLQNLFEKTTLAKLSRETEGFMFCI